MYIQLELLMLLPAMLLALEVAAVITILLLLAERAMKASVFTVHHKILVSLLLVVDATLSVVVGSLS